MTEWGPAAVYMLCLATSAACTLLLARAWGRSRSQLLFWTSLSFALLTINNLLLVADMVFFATVDFSVWRQLSSGAALAVMLYAFVWETR